MQTKNVFEKSCVVEASNYEISYEVAPLIACHCLQLLQLLQQNQLTKHVTSGYDTFSYQVKFLVKVKGDKRFHKPWG